MGERAIIYARVSSDDQVEGSSLDTQVAACLTYCQEQGYTVVGEYREDITGATADRPEINKVLELAQKGVFDRLVVYSVDRFARKLAIQLLLEHDFEDLAVKVEYATGSYQDSPEGTLAKQIQAVIAEYERAQINRRTAQGRRARIRSGNVMPGRTPAYGYRYVGGERTGRYEIAEEEARIIRQIFDWYTKGDEHSKKLGVVSIARRLSEMRVPTKWDIHGHNKRKRQRGVWGPSSVHAILTNRVYIGEWSYGKKTASPIQVPVPPIISEEQFEAAQKQRKKNFRHSKRNTKYNYLLRRRMTCAVCGFKFNARTKHENSGNLSVHYFCNGQKSAFSTDFQTKTCYGSLVAPQIDDLAWTRISAFLKDPDIAFAGLENQKAEMNKRSEAIQRQLERWKKAIAEQQEKQDRLVELYSDQKIPRDVLDRQISEAQSAIAGAQEHISDLQISLNGSLPDTETITTTKQLIRKIGQGIDDFNYEERLKTVELLDISCVVNRRGKGIPKIDIFVQFDGLKLVI